MKKLLLLLLLLIGSVPLWATVPNAPFSVTYTCTGSTGPFPFTFPITDATALTVIENGALVPSTSYTIVPVNNNYNNGGKVTLNSACTAGWLLVLTRDTPITQAIKFYDNMPIPMTTFERGLDKITEIAQELNGLIAGGGGGGGGVIPCGLPGDIQLFLDATHLGCASGAATIDPLTATLTIGAPGVPGTIVATKEIDVTGSGAGEIDLGVDGTAAGLLQLSNGSAAFHTILASAATANYTFKFPPTAGTATWLLKTDGSGNTDWVAPGSGGVGTVTNVSGTTNQIGVANPTTTPVISLSSTIVFPGSVTMGASAADFSSATSFKVPSYAGGVTAADGLIAFNTTAKSYHIFQNSGDAIVASFKTTPTNGQCASWVTDGTSFVLGSQACSALAVAGSSGDIQMNSGSGTLAASSINESATEINFSKSVSFDLATAGAGGVTQNLLAAADSSNPVKYVLPVSGNCGVGFALTTATSGNTFWIGGAVQEIYTGVADNSVTSGHILIGGTATPGRVKDSGGTQITGVPVGTCVVGKALASATVGNTVPVLYMGLGTFGTSGTATYTGSITGGHLAAFTGTGGQISDSSSAHSIAIPLDCADSSGSGTAQSCTTTPSFTPAAGDCIIYTTTTANTGTGLTLNVNSTAARSVAKWQGDTTLAANDVLANKRVLACFDAANVWELSTIGNAPAGGITTITVPPDILSPTSCTGPTCAYTKQNINPGYFLVGPTPGTLLQPYIAQSKACPVANSLNSYTCTFDQAVGAGNTLYVTLVNFPSFAGGSVFTVGDGVDSFTKPATTTDGRSYVSAYAENVTGGTVTITITNNDALTAMSTLMIISEVANVATSSIDVVSTAANNCGGATLPANTTTVAGDIVIGTCMINNTAEAYTTGGSWLFGVNYSQGSPAIAGAMVYETGLPTGTWTPNINAPSFPFSNETFTISFKAKTSGGGAAPFAARPMIAADATSAGIPAVYSSTGGLQTGSHIVEGVCTLGTSCSVTLTNAAIYTSATTYQCTCADQTSAAACKFAPSSGTAFVLTGTGTDVLSYICVGN